MDKILKKMGFYSKGMFTTKSNILDGAFLQKPFTAKRHYLFSQKSFIVDVWLGSKHAFGLSSQYELNKVQWVKWVKVLSNV